MTNSTKRKSLVKAGTFFLSEMMIRYSYKGGDFMTDAELIEKKVHISELLGKVNDLLVDKFFDFNSDKLLDEKIEVLTALSKGKHPADISRYYDIFELYPKAREGVSIHWD